MSVKTLAYLAPTILLTVALFLSYWQYKADEEKWAQKATEAYQEGRGAGFRYGYRLGRAVEHQALQRDLDEVEEIISRTEGSQEDFKQLFLDIRNG